MKDYVIYCDGATEPVNPGGYGSAAWCVDGETTEAMIWLGKQWKSPWTGKLTPMTNNIAEYNAVGRALKWVLVGVESGERPASSVVIRTDSQLAIKQLRGEWECRSSHLLEIRDAILKTASNLKSRSIKVEFEWVPREQNARADVLSKKLYADHGVRVTERRG